MNENRVTKLTYSSYLQLEHLLALQTGVEAEKNNDELLFVIVHQVSELWFKLLINSIETAMQYLQIDHVSEARSALNRCRLVIKSLENQMDVIGTLTPVAFNQYRNRLEGSSGLQSWQFRDLEFLLGYRRQSILSFYSEGTNERRRLEARLQSPSANDILLEFIHRHISRHKEHADSLNLHQKAVTLYQQEKEVAGLFDLLLDIDEGFQEWRYRHVKLVERVIGTKQGTGGTQGLEFLKATLFNPFFPVLWEIRGML